MSILPAIKIIVSTTRPSLNYYCNFDNMDISKLATLVHHLPQKPSATHFQQVGEEAKHIRTEVIRALDLTADKIEAYEKRATERRGKDANSLSSPEYREELIKAADRVASYSHLWVQQAAFEGMAKASQDWDLTGVKQCLEFAQKPQHTVLELAQRVRKQEAKDGPWPGPGYWAGIAVAALVAYWLQG